MLFFFSKSDSMKKTALLSFFIFVVLGTIAQTQISISSQTADNILKGNYNPADYTNTPLKASPKDLPNEIYGQINTDSLKSYITTLSKFYTRHTSSDTISSDTGIGATRRWVHQKFQQFSSASNNRLVTGYVDFRAFICNVLWHKNVIAVLPGKDINNHQVVIIEGHMDSRCSDNCDRTCRAEGVEDNASGTVLVMELARVMSLYEYDHTIVFMATTGEEQGLVGASAMADYCKSENIPVKAVLNNDVIGGIICGETSSPPSCPGLNDIDSLNTRIFSYGSYRSPSKGLARYVKLQYKESLTNSPVKVALHIMTNEDRIGRGGDHIPFRGNGFPAIRFTSANEHGDASNGPDYNDRQHTEEDILGVDTDGDQVVDSFFVDFNYLKRNGSINATAAANIANAPETPEFSIMPLDYDLLQVTITSAENHPQYRVGVRSTTNDWDSVYTSTSKTINLALYDSNAYYISVAAVNQHGIESLFSMEELQVMTSLNEDEAEIKGIELWQNKPNPFDESTIIPIYAGAEEQGKLASLTITDLSGNVVYQKEERLVAGLNEWPYHHGFGALGTFIYTLAVEGELIGSKKMTFAY